MEYRTNFPLTQNPISEGGNWLNGGTNGIDFTDVQTYSNHATGTVIQPSPPSNDAVASLTGTWGPCQVARAVVKNTANKIGTEVELHLNTLITPHSVTSYEFDYVLGADNLQIVRWNGPVNNFTALTGLISAAIPNNCEILAVSANGNLYMYINGVLKLQAFDTTYTNGSPGMGFFNQATIPDFDNFGFLSFYASDQVATVFGEDGVAAYQFSW